MNHSWKEYNTVVKLLLSERGGIFNTTHAKNADKNKTCLMG